MKKTLLFIALFLQMALFAQTAQTIEKPLKLTNVVKGVANDSILVRGADKIVKHLPVSQLKTITNLDYLATPTGGTVFSSAGNDAVLPLATATNAGLQSPNDKSKLDGIATGATANQTDDYLLARTNHTGEQLISTVTGLQTALDTKVDKVAGERLINAAEITKLSNQSGTNTGDQDLSGLVVKNAPITAATNTKITYDSKGLVTGGTSLIASDIPTLNQNTTGTASTITGNIAESQVTGLVGDLNAKQNTSEKNTANGYAGLGSDGKLISSQLPSITISDTFVTASQAAMLALVAETGDVAVRTDLNKSFILKGVNPAVLADWQELLTPTSAVTTVFGRNGAVTAQTGDYTADQITETANRKFQTANQNTFNDATSSIQTQLNAKQATITAGTTAQYRRGDNTWQTLDKTAVGLGNVDNTTDLNKPISTATQTALNGKQAAGSYEPAFAKNTAFNKNFGTTAGTVAEGNDSRILNGQTAYGWGNHGGLYLPLTGGVVSGLIGTSLGTGGLSLSGNSSPDETFLGNNYYNINGTEFNGDGRDSWRIKFKNVITPSNSLFSIDYREANAGAGVFTSLFNIKGTGAATFPSTVTASEIIVPEIRLNKSTDTGSIDKMIVGYSGDGVQHWSSSSQIKSWLGLGSNAYTSTAYLPLTGGIVTGSIISNLTGAIGTVDGNTSYRMYNSGTTAYGIGVNGSQGGLQYMANQTEANMPHRFYGGAENTSPKLLLTIYDNGNVDALGGVTAKAFSMPNSGPAVTGNWAGSAYWGFGGSPSNAHEIVIDQIANNATGQSFAGASDITLKLGTKTVLDSGNYSSYITDSRPYKVYTAILNQSGTSAPTAIVLENTLGQTPTWSRNQIGQYTLTVTGSILTLDKTISIISNGWVGTAVTNSHPANANSVVVETFSTIDSSGRLDDLLNKTPIEIRVYN
jgi:hypothetical protein